jgi:hypothetical protein
VKNEKRREKGQRQMTSRELELDEMAPPAALALFPVKFVFIDFKFAKT